MAKVKTWALELEIVSRRTVFVEARKPGGAVDKLTDPREWARAVAYTEDELLSSVDRIDQPNVRLVSARQVP